MRFDTYGCTTIQASRFILLNKFTQVFNIADLSSKFSIKFPDDFPRDCDLVDIFDFDKDSSINYSGGVSRTEHQPWIDVNTELLDLSNGQHIYRFTFQNNSTEFEYSFWISYIIQNHNEEKPYIYMKHGEVTPDEDISQS